MNHTIVLRHADRQQLINSQLSPSAKLTLEGRIKTISHGIFLRKRFNPIHEIYSGNTKRCIDTAYLLTFPLSPINGLPIKTATDEYDYFSVGYLQKGMFGAWLNQIFSSDYHWKRYADIFPIWERLGFLKYSLKEYGQILLRRYLLTHNILAVTHDCTIGPMMESLAMEFGFRVHEFMIKPTQLSGFCIEHNDKEISAIRWLEFGKEPLLIW